MEQIDFRKIIQNEIKNGNKMEAGKFILELVKIEKISKTEIDFLFECLQKKGCNYHASLFCLYVFNSGLINKCSKHKEDILNIAKAEINMFKKEIEQAKLSLLRQQELMFFDPVVKKVGGNRKAFEALGEKEKKHYLKKFNNLAELMVAHKSKLLNFAIACNGETIVQDYDQGTISKKQYVLETNKYANLIPEICERYGLEGPAEIVIKRTDFQEK